MFPLDGNSRLFHQQQHQQTQGIHQIIVANDEVVRRSFRSLLSALEKSQNILRVLKIELPRGYIKNVNSNSDSIVIWYNLLERRNIKFPHLQELALTTIDMYTEML